MAVPRNPITIDTSDTFSTWLSNTNLAINVLKDIITDTVLTHPSASAFTAGSTITQATTGASGGTGGGGNGGNHPNGNGGAGTANTGGGGGGCSSAPGGNDGDGAAGGSGIVIVKELAGTYAPGIHSMSDVYEQRKAGNWG